MLFRFCFHCCAYRPLSQAFMDYSAFILQSYSVRHKKVPTDFTNQIQIQRDNELWRETLTCKPCTQPTHLVARQRLENIFNHVHGCVTALLHYSQYRPCTLLSYIHLSIYKTVSLQRRPQQRYGNSVLLHMCTIAWFALNTPSYR